MKSTLVILLVGALSVTSAAFAQTPQQMEMLRMRQGEQSTARQVRIDEKTGRFSIPKNTNPPTIDVDSGDKMPLPMEKTDEEIWTAIAAPHMFLFDRMNPEEQESYLDFIAEDRIFVSTSDFDKLTTTGGMKMCRLNLSIYNNTPRVLKSLKVTYHFGEEHTTASFSNLPPLGKDSFNLAFGGAICDVMGKGVKYTYPVCNMEGLTKEQCQLRIFEQ